MDLYYDPVADEHLASPVGLIAPIWYMAPQRRDFAEAAWTTAASISGLLDGGDLVGLDDPRQSVILAWHTGEFIEGTAKSRLWDHLAATFEPTWDYDLGEFTFRFGLDEPYPRGQLNARAMAGWVCTPGAWYRIFNEPNLTKFNEPTVSGIDFPRVAMSEARWDGVNLHLATHPQNASVAGTRTWVRVTGISDAETWVLTRPDGTTELIEKSRSSLDLDLELVVDGSHYQLRKS